MCEGHPVRALRRISARKLNEQLAHARKDGKALTRQLFQTRFVCLGRIPLFRRDAFVGCLAALLVAVPLIAVVAIVAVVAFGVTRVELSRIRCVRDQRFGHGDVFIETVNQFVDAQFTRLNLRHTRKNRGDRRRTGRNRVDHLVKAVFDAFRNLNFTRARQQLRPAHFPHVHPHGIGGATELRIHRGERDFRFFVSLIVRHRGRCRGVQEQRLSIRSLLINRRAHIVEGADNGFNRSGLREVVRQVIVDFRVSQVAARFAQLDQRAHLALPLFVLYRRGHRVQRQ
ncbi:hypothetical protein AWB82_04171 [Caballeronia glebae]|uniref:Uncharacterized protein n=1 Tax=Caballeronia glebae TaxID=1777143 RepID=A0A158BJ44_9BURK|nr:hypothetical protein AWB82_04171 [Caballeronia glebae]